MNHDIVKVLSCAKALQIFHDVEFYWCFDSTVFVFCEALLLGWILYPYKLILVCLSRQWTPLSLALPVYIQKSPPQMYTDLRWTWVGWRWKCAMPCLEVQFSKQLTNELIQFVLTYTG